MPSIHEQMFQLQQLAIKGDQAASRHMYDMAYWATLLLNSLVQKKPDLFIPIAARQRFWPMLWGAHRDDMKENKALAESLTLGTQSGINFSQLGKTFSLDVPANHIAIYLVSLAQLASQYRASKGRLSQRVIASVRRCVQSNGADDLKAWADWEGENLPPFSRSTVNAWKPTVRKLFRLCYGERFDKHPRLQELKHWIMGHAKDRYGKQTPGVVRAAMLKKVFQALNSIAPSN